MDDTVANLIQENEWIEKELFNPGSVENSIWVSSSPKRDLITRWAVNLEKLQALKVYDAPVNTISSHISAKLREAGMTSAIFYVRESLDYKYKLVTNVGKDNLDEYESMNEDDPRSDSSFDYSIQNKNYIQIISDTIDVLKEFKRALEKKMEIEPHIPRVEWDEYALRMNYSLARLSQILDGREKVPPTTMHLLVYAKAQATLSDAYSHYVRFRTEEAELTPKQSGKILKQHVSKTDLLYEPLTKHQAKSAGFIGQQCMVCGSWRTERRYNPNSDIFMLYCFARQEWSKFIPDKITMV